MFKAQTQLNFAAAAMALVSACVDSPPQSEVPEGEPIERPAPVINCETETCLSPDLALLDAPYVAFARNPGLAANISCGADVDFCGTTVDACSFANDSHAVVLARVVEVGDADNCPVGDSPQFGRVVFEVVANFAGYAVPEVLAFRYSKEARHIWQVGETHLIGARELGGEWVIRQSLNATLVDHEPDLPEYEDYRIRLPVRTTELADLLQNRFDLYGVDPMCPHQQWSADEAVQPGRDCPCHSSLPVCSNPLVGP